MNNTKQKHLENNSDRVHTLITELNSTLDMYYDNDIEREYEHIEQSS